MSVLLTRTWEHSTGARMALQHLAIDTGFATQSVYQWARSQDRGTVLPVRGVGTYDRIVPVAGPTKVEVRQDGKRLKRGLGLWTVSVSFFKKELYKQLGVEPPTDEQLAQGLHLSDRLRPSARHDERRVGQAAGRRTAGDRALAPWLPRTHRVAPAAAAQRGARRPRLCPRGGLAGRRDRWGDNRWRALETQLGHNRAAAAQATATAALPAIAQADR